jgi:ankyrin repeat protein
MHHDGGLMWSQGVGLDQTDYDGRSAMHFACSWGRFKMVECLLKLGASHSLKDRWHQTPLAIAVKAKHQMVITVLAAHEAKLDMVSPELVLCTAAGVGDLTLVKQLIDFGVQPNVGDYDRRCALVQLSLFSRLFSLTIIICNIQNL